MERHPERFASFYTAPNISLDIRLIQLGYSYFRPHFHGRTCLELGPATGYMTRLLVDDFETVHAVEGSKILLDQVAEHPRLVKVHSLFDDYVPALGFDTIMVNHVLEHIEEPVELLKKSKAWLVSNGVAIVSVPNAKSFHRLAAVEMGLLDSEYQLNDRDRALGHYRVYDFAALESDVLAAGFTIKARGGTFLKFLANAQMESVMDDRILKAFHDVGQRFIANCAEIYLVLTH